MLPGSRCARRSPSAIRSAAQAIAPGATPAATMAPSAISPASSSSRGPRAAITTGMSGRQRNSRPPPAQSISSPWNPASCPLHSWRIRATASLMAVAGCSRASPQLGEARAARPHAENGPAAPRPRPGWPAPRRSARDGGCTDRSPGCPAGSGAWTRRAAPSVTYTSRIQRWWATQKLSIPAARRPRRPPGPGPGRWPPRCARAAPPEPAGRAGGRGRLSATVTGPAGRAGSS